MDGQTIWSPQPGPQQALVECPFPEIFFGGARGGGKTDGVLGKWAIKEKRYGADFNAIMFRRTTVSAEDAVERSKQIYLPLGAKFVGSPNPTWRMPNGGRVSFRYLESVDDAQEWQGRNVTDAWVEEAGQYPMSAPIDRLFGVLRSAAGVPVQMILTANPGGAGQHWIKDRYKLYPFPEAPVVLRRELSDGSMHAMAVIPSRLRDNKILLSRDPKYINRLQLVGSKELVKAWLEGDWSAIEGAFFDEWNEGRHVIRPFPVPLDWKRFRSMDWGSARPFSVGWWALCPDDHEAFNLHGQSLVIPPRCTGSLSRMVRRKGSQRRPEDDCRRCRQGHFGARNGESAGGHGVPGANGLRGSRPQRLQAGRRPINRRDDGSVEGWVYSGRQYSRSPARRHEWLEPGPSKTEGRCRRSGHDGVFLDLQGRDPHAAGSPARSRPSGRCGYRVGRSRPRRDPLCLQLASLPA